MKPLAIFLNRGRNEGMTKKISGLFLIFIACYLGAHFYIRHKNTVYDDVSKIGRLIECEQNEFKIGRAHV